MTERIFFVRNNGVSNALPEMARNILVAASKTEVTKLDPLARVKAIEKATAKVKSMYPHLFVRDED